MSDLEAEWAQRLMEAEQRARVAGRGDVADYLALRALNDMARHVGVNWLLETFTLFAGEANRAGASVSLTHEETHRFRVGNSTMIGKRLLLRAGVRTITVEAGWPRAPADGIVRGGGLACANIRHFGDRRAGEALLLVHSADAAPQWFVLEDAGRRASFQEENVRCHLAKLLA